MSPSRKPRNFNTAKLKPFTVSSNYKSANILYSRKIHCTCSKEYVFLSINWVQFGSFDNLGH